MWLCQYCILYQCFQTVLWYYPLPDVHQSNNVCRKQTICPTEYAGQRIIKISGGCFMYKLVISLSPKTVIAGTTIILYGCSTMSRLAYRQRNHINLSGDKGSRTQIASIFFRIVLPCQYNFTRRVHTVNNYYSEREGLIHNLTTFMLFRLCSIRFTDSENERQITL